MILAVTLSAACVGGFLLPLTMVNRILSRLPDSTIKAIMEGILYCLSAASPVFILWMAWLWGEQILSFQNGIPSVGWNLFLFLSLCWLTFILYTVVDLARHLRGTSVWEGIQTNREILPFQPGPEHPRIWFPNLNGIYRLNRSRITITVPGLDENLKGLRLGHLTDFHFGKHCHRDFARHAVDTLMELEPDVLAVTGDFLNFSKYLDECFDLLSKIQAPLGVYATCGNHDYWAGIEKIQAGIDRAGFELLEDRTVEVYRKGARFVLSGIESRWNQSRIPLDYIPKDSSTLRIVLSHTPDEFPRLVSRDPHLVLAGHTHGGQVCFPFFGPVVVPSDFGRRYASGLFKQGNSLLYVSRGIGCYPPFRMLCDPEVTLFEFV